MFSLISFASISAFTPLVLGYEPAQQNILRTNVLNDSGSDSVQIYPTDGLTLANLPVQYINHILPVHVIGVHGAAPSWQFPIQCRISDAARTQYVGDWYTEYGTFHQPINGVPRVSGVGFRRAFFIGLSPYGTAAFGKNKSSMANILPAA